MAGLLDIFGGSSSDLYGGLLGEEGLAQAKRQAQADALMNLSTSLLKAGAPSRTPQGLGLGLMEGMQAASKGYKDAMTSAVQERLTQAKIAEALAAKKRAAGAQELLQTSLQPQQVTTATAGPGGVPYPVTTGFQPQNLQDLIPQFAKYGTEGFEALKQYTDLQKSIAGEAFNLGEGETRYMTDISGKTTQVATGAPKVQRLTGKEGNAALMFYGTDDVNQLRNIPGAVDKIRTEATTQRKSEQPQINLNDPTAVQVNQLKTINQWEGLLKDSGDNVAASRANAFYDAYNQAKKGNVSADGAMIYHIAKQYDTTGAVQQGDVGTIIGNRSIPTEVQLFAQKFKNGGSFTPKERENLKSIVDGLVGTRKKMIEPSLKTYRKINKSLGGTDDAIPNPYDLITKPQSLDEILGG